MISKKPLIMIMGVQRSGTSALFNTLASAPGLTGRTEHVGDAIYDDFDLRPEPEIRQVLHSLPGTILLKPVNESKRRAPWAVAEEYAGYELRIIWIYRDPVNVFCSFLQKGWGRGGCQKFADSWVARNQLAIESIEPLGDRFLVVRYEDIVSNPGCVAALADRLGLSVRSCLRADSQLGRQHLAPEIQAKMQTRTADMPAKLDAARSITPETIGLNGPRRTEPRRTEPRRTEPRRTEPC
jgi:hypothetical protein